MYGKFNGSYFKVRTVITYVICSIATVLLLLWIFCLPANLFEDVKYSTVVEDCNGRLLGARIADDGQWRFPLCDSLPEKFVTALVEFEDRRFYDHNGVSFRSLARAMHQNLSNGRVVSGGSTISMQVIRLSRPAERTILNKVVECFLATRLESRYSKEEILRLYASHAPFGGNVVGIDAAMWRYLGSDEYEMSWAEAATLAVLQNSPSTITPSKNRDALLAKRNRLLLRLYESGHMTEEECTLSLEEPLMDEPYHMPQFVPHLVDWYNMNEHGQKVVTNINLDLQKQVDAVTVRWSQELRLLGANDLAAVVVDVKTNEVIAYCGNADMEYDREGKWVDIARAPRSSGSILKPILYCSALQKGQIMPTMLISDVPTDFGGFAPKNYSGIFNGAVPADEAIAQSLNVPCVEMLKTYGVMSFVELLRDCGLTSLNRPSESYGLSVILGGAEVTLLDMTRLYARMSACYQDSNTGAFPLDDKVALYYAFQAMRKVNRPDQLDWRRVNSVQNVAWKTGTSYGSRDAWAIGVTPDYVVGVWVGNANGSGTPDLTGARTAGPVMFDLMNLLPFSEWFAEPMSEIGAEVRVCKYSGCRAGKYCSVVETVLGAQSSVNAPQCPYCHPVHLSLDGRHQIMGRSEQTRTENRFILPPAMEYYYKVHHPEYTALPPYKESCNQLASSESPMKFLYPEDGSVIKLPRNMDGTKGKLSFNVAHSNHEMELFWHCDDEYVGSTKDLHMIQMELAPGMHSVSVVDTHGNTINTTVSVI